MKPRRICFVSAISFIAKRFGAVVSRGDLGRASVFLFGLGLVTKRPSTIQAFFLPLYFPSLPSPPRLRLVPPAFSASWVFSGAKGEEGERDEDGKGKMSRSLGIPVKLLHEAAGHVVTVELKTGEVYRGSMVECEDNWNCQLENITFTAKVRSLRPRYLRI